MSKNLTIRFLCVLSIAVLVLSSHATANPGPLLEEIDAHRQIIVAQLRQSNAKTVGVLKFQIRRQRGGPMPGGGDLANDCANWVETAVRRHVTQAGWDDELTIVPHASDTAGAIGNANHHTESGRSKLFEQQYPLDDTRNVKIDTFLTGDILVHNDLGKVDVRIQRVHEGGGKPIPVLTFAANTQRGLMSALGFTYQRREWDDPVTAQKNAVELRQGRTTLDTSEEMAPVSFQVLYDGKVVEPKNVDGFTLLPEPGEGRNVSFRLERRDRSDRTLAVAIKVNGENVLWRRRIAHFAGPKYVLEKDDPAILINGFQDDDEKGERFVIASRQESKELESFYGQDVGTISVVVFVEDEFATPIDEEVMKTARLLDASEEDPVSVPKYQDRGLITPGDEKVAQPIRLTESKNWDPNPIYSMVYFYYSLQDKQ